MNPELRAELFVLDFLRIHGPSTSRRVAKEALACRIFVNIGELMFKMVEDKVLTRTQGGNRYYVYAIRDEDEAEGLAGILRLMAGGE